LKTAQIVSEGLHKGRPFHLFKTKKARKLSGPFLKKFGWKDEKNWVLQSLRASNFEAKQPEFMGGFKRLVLPWAKLAI